MCAIRYCISVGDGPCAVHQKYPTLGPLEVGHPTPFAGCSEKEAEYILQACGTPPENDEEDEDWDDGVEDEDEDEDWDDGVEDEDEDDDNED